MIRPPIVFFLCTTICLATLAARSPEQDRTQKVTAADVQALLAGGVYEQAEVLAGTWVDALQDQYGENSLEVAVASDLLVRALLLNGKGSSASTLALAERTLRSKQAHLGRSHPDLAFSLTNLGNALGEAVEHPRAIAALEQAVALQQNRATSSNLGLAEALDALGSELIRAGQYDNALRALRRSLRIKDSTGDDERSVATTLDSIALGSQWKGDYGGARVPLERALALQRAGEEHPVDVQTLTLLGRQLWFEGNLPEARRASERAVEAAQRTLRPDHPTTAWSLRNLAATVLDLGDLAQARSLQERALAIVERSLGPSHYETAAYLNGLADSNRLLGAYPTAHALYEKALKIAEARLGSQHDWIATFVHNLALVDANLGDYESARRQQARATAIWERVLGRDHPFVAVALTELAAVHREQGSGAEALPLLERALEIRERSLGPEHRDVARTLADLSATLMQLGQSDRAQDLAARALRIWEKVDAPEAPDLATVLELYADLQSRRGDAAAARRYYERALRIKEKVFGRSHPAFASTQAALALVLAGLGDQPAALKTANEAETTGREHLRVMLRYLPERQSLNYAANRPKGLDLELSLIGVIPDAAMIALDGLIRSRAIVLDEMAARRGAATAYGEEVAPLRAQLASAQQRLANLVVRGPSGQTAGHYASLVEAARRESELAERTLAERSAPFRAELGRSQLGLEQVRASLPSDSALISFVRYEHVRSDVLAQNARADVSGRPASRRLMSYLAFVLRPHLQPVAVPLGSADEIDATVSRWRGDIGHEALVATRTSGVSRRSSRSSGTTLRKLVWDPLAGHLSGARQIFIVPDGTLSLVPFVALPDGQVGYLLEEAPVIHYLSAERDLAMPPAQSGNVGEGLLALGGPTFDDRTLFGRVRNQVNPVVGFTASASASVRAVGPGCASFQSVKFQRLDGALQEVQEVAGLWRAPPTAGNGVVRLLVGRDASERAFKQEAPRYRVLHLATHGFFLGDSCPSGPSGTRSVGGLVTTSRARLAPARSENPLLLSGLALAGANRRSAAGPEEDDGILTAEEVASLNLGGVEWAVLSACDTGIGEIQAGEGVFGLRRAFQVAGVRTVIMSLWSVDDQAARAWMRALYQGRIEQHLTTADAVRAASGAVLRDRRAKGQSTLPFYWAAFVAAGDWR